MADIQQWRRKIQPARSRTPATTFLDTEDREEYSLSTTPKKRLKPKLSSYFGNHAKQSLQGENPVTAELPAWPPDRFYSDPKPEDVMDAVMCSIMAAPYQSLEPRHNSSLMLIFESFVNTLEGKKQLQRRLEAEVASSEDLIVKLNMAEKDWEDEKQDYKDEVKRLEVLLAKASKRGLAEVTLARQDSKLHNRDLHKKETIFEFLEKSMLYNDKTWSSQRATMRPILQSAIDEDTHTSRQLVEKKSMTHLHADLPFGTPPAVEPHFSLTNASLVGQQQRMKHNRKRAATASTVQSTSDDTFSTFSCEETTSPDQTVLATLRHSAPSDHDDYASVEKIAEILAHRRKVDPARVMPQLLQRFNGHSLESDRAVSTPEVPANHAPWPKRTSSTIAPIGIHGPKHRTVMSKASGFFQKLVPQLTVDTTASGHPTRRFSFEPGEDVVRTSNLVEGRILEIKDHVLRKSASAYALRSPGAVMPARSLSPVAQSPTPSFLAEARVGPPSRIPTPVFSSGSLARPRQEREDSAASLLTVINQSDELSPARSVSSSSYSSPSSGLANFAQAAREVLAIQSPVPLPSSSSSNRLLDRTNSLRGPYLATAAARAATSEAGIDPKVHLRRPSSQHSRNSHSTNSVSNIPYCENIPPTT